MIVRERERERERERFVERILLILYFLRQRNISIIIHNVCAFLKGTYDSMYITHTSVVGQTSLPFLQYSVFTYIIIMFCYYYACKNCKITTNVMLIGNNTRKEKYTLWEEWWTYRIFTLLIECYTISMSVYTFTRRRCRPVYSTP